MNLKEIIEKTNFEFKKKFGQNFISDTNLLNSIVADAGIEKTDEVLEIGVGAGTLTKCLSENAQKVVGIEIDNSLKEIHSLMLAGCKNVEVVYNDFMKMKSDEINLMFSKPFKVVANLPYYITTPIIFKLLEEDFNLQSLTLMVQKEVADRLVSNSGTKDYGAITVQINSIADAKIMRQVNRKMFMPMPNVDSSIIRIDINKQKYDIKNYQIHKKLIECAFSMRRKTLSNCLKAYFNLSQIQIENLLNSCNLPILVRGEALTIQQFVQLSNQLSLIL